MAVTLVTGAQWGDEGKGKIIDCLSETSDFVVRYHGGNNAGHTVINQFGKFALHLLPSGVFNPKAVVCISNGTVVDLQVLLEEIAMLQKAGISLKNRLLVSPRCNIIMPYHRTLEKVYEEAKGKGKTGTTGRGIGPVHADKVSYNGIRLFDLIDKKLFEEKLHIQLTVKNKIIKGLSEQPLDEKLIMDMYMQYRAKLLPYITEPYPVLQQAIKKNKKILLEGAQGIFLDNDWGTYPFVTASTTVAGGITPGAGIAPKQLSVSLGVVKAYTTRVGEGPFPTELLDTTGEKLRAEGNEFGATTGRPRRCGWFDAELVRFAAEINGYTGLAITKLDVLDDFDELKVCTGYLYNGKIAHYYDGDALFLGKVKPVYKTVKGWKTSTKGLRTFTQLPKNAKIYITLLEKLIGVPVTFISTGEKREDLIKL